MISANNISLRVGKKALFEEVNIKFTEGNCYGLIGANGAGKSTFLKILSGQLEPTSGEIAIAYIGEPLGKLEDVDLVVALPEQEEWTISTEEGTTTANAMSSFAMKTADGRELSFLKDNCPIEDGALSEDSGDLIWVTYVTSEGMNFPVEIVKGQ